MQAAPQGCEGCPSSKHGWKGFALLCSPQGKGGRHSQPLPSPSKWGKILLNHEINDVAYLSVSFWLSCWISPLKAAEGCRCASERVVAFEKT